MNLERIDEPIVYAPTIKQKNDGAFVDWFTTALLIVLAVGIIAAFFVTFDIAIDLSVKSMTINTAWFAISTFSLGTLTKRLFRRKGRQTKAYTESKAEATEAIKALNESEYGKRAGDYAAARTRETIARYRKHELTAVGIAVEKFEREYLGKGIKTLWKDFWAGKLSLLQCRAIHRCNHVRIKAYDPNFITSYYATTKVMQTASAAIDVQGIDRRNDFQSVVFTVFSAFGIGVMFSNVILDFSVQTLFLAIIKIIVIGINVGMKASLGWDLSLMEIQRNKLRESEAKACIEWAKTNPERVEI